MFRQEAEAFFAALRFFSRLPVPAWVGHSAEQLQRAPRYFPLVGVLIGLIGGVVTLAALAVLPPGVAIALGMAATILATGAFHEDGFADTCDGFGGGWDKAQVLTIMKDSRLGSYGAIGVTLMLLAKWNALMDIQPEFLLSALIAAHAASRLAAAMLMATLDYARTDDDAKAKPATSRLGAGTVAIAALLGLSPAALLPLPELAAALGLATLATVLLAVYFARRIGGYTGDCLGATQQVAELAFYLGLLCDFS